MQCRSLRWENERGKSPVLILKLQARRISTLEFYREKDINICLINSGEPSKLLWSKKPKSYGSLQVFDPKKLVCPLQLKAQLHNRVTASFVPSSMAEWRDLWFSMKFSPLRYKGEITNWYWFDWLLWMSLKWFEQKEMHCHLLGLEFLNIPNGGGGSWVTPVVPQRAL